MINYVRTNRTQPNWIKDDLWKIMCAYWDSDDAKKRSETYSKNCTSDPEGLGVGRHVGGPKSTETIRRALSIEEGREVSYGEVFIKTRKRKNGSFVDEKAKRIAEAYHEKLQSAQSQISTTSDGASNSAQLTVEQQNALFVETTPKNGRGKPYGLGRLAKKQKKIQQALDLAGSSQISHLEKKLKDTEREMVELKENNKNQLEFVMEQLRQLNPNLPKWKPPHHTSPAVDLQQSSRPPLPPTDDGNTSDHSSSSEEEEEEEE